MCDVTPYTYLEGPSEGQVEAALSRISNLFPCESNEWKIARAIFYRSRVLAFRRPSKVSRLLLLIRKLGKIDLSENQSIKRAIGTRTRVQKLFELLDADPKEKRHVSAGKGPMHIQLTVEDKSFATLDCQLDAFDRRLIEAFKATIKHVGSDQVRREVDDVSEEKRTPRKYWWCYPVRYVAGKAGSLA